jgi:cytochrome c biogenesis protein CcdA
MKRIILSSLLIIFPLYRFIIWILIYKEFKSEPQSIKVMKYQEKYFFNVSMHEPIVTSLSILLLLIAIYLLGKHLYNKQNYILWLLLIIAILLLLFNTWTLM